MASYNVLYYPGFHPDPKWSRRILLLADSLIRIVPTDVPTHDSSSLLALQDAVPGCLQSVSPLNSDTTFNDKDMPRLAKAFALLGDSRGATARKRIEVHVSRTGTISVLGHTFLHNDKVSPIILDELRRNRLIIEGLDKYTDFGGFLVVDESASNLILSSIAANISQRMALDAITDKGIPFALNSLNNLHVARVPSGGAEGMLLSSLASVLIPLEAVTLDIRAYRELRDACSPIRIAFKELTAELTKINRLDHVTDPKYLRELVKAVATDFFKEYRRFRESRYARSFKKWVPLYIGGLLSMAAAAVEPRTAMEIAGVSLVIQVIQRKIDDSQNSLQRERVFNMLAGMRKDIIRRSEITQIV